ncbi:ComEA family DNA-binding protein [Streptomyces sp. NBC_01497]|nr:ComEA family DNA-binding protein [Streptomyces sp. NBC_01497]
MPPAEVVPEPPPSRPGGPAASRGWSRGAVSGGERFVSAVRDRLPVWARLRFGIEPRALAALGAVLAVAAILAVQHFWVARPRAVSAPETTGTSQAAGTAHPAGAHPGRPAPAAGPPPSPPAPSASSAPGSPDSASSTGAGGVVVDVGGAVRHPGVLRLPAGSRVEDALREAGGPKDGTDLSTLNRARVLVDGEQVVVGAPAGAAPTGGVPASPSAPGAPAGPLNLNVATLEQLDTLPGVGPVLAQHILDYRTQNGGFRSVDELREVNGIGERRFADLQALVRP